MRRRLGRPALASSSKTARPSGRDTATSGRLWPKEPTLQNFDFVFNQKHFYLNHFWVQMWNSLVIAVTVGALTLFISTAAAFAISRLKVRGGRTVMNLALFTYFIPAAFLAVPMYKAMGNYGLLNSQWALILAMVTIASPYCIWVLKQAADKLPFELDEAARMEMIKGLLFNRIERERGNFTVYRGKELPSLAFSHAADPVSAFTDDAGMRA